MSILDYISSPADLKPLSTAELEQLATEIRARIIDTTSRTGGHVASSLGAVEIILALHSLLDTPKDKIVFDVGHQSYAHKLVTGRFAAFDTLRQVGGISGFPHPHESIFDVHPSGHASDSLGVASGLAKARVLNGTDEKIVVLIGDASIAGGMAFEALNHIGTEQLPVVIILNDNEMSISRNVGALMKHLGDMRATHQYRDAREALQERMEEGGFIASAMLNFGKNVKESVKQFVLPHSMIFEQLGIVCTPPIDGHNIAALKETLALVLPMDAPVLVHVVTRKGEGYGPAMEDPERFHGIGAYDKITGRTQSDDEAHKTYTQVFGETLVREAESDSRIIAITAAMEGGTGLKDFATRFPERFIDVGIAEEQAVAMASGLALAGKKPIVALYSTFMQRALDQMVVDCCLANLNVVFMLDRAGVVGDDGPTHHGVFDIVYTRMVPNLRVLAPSNEAELADALHTALVLGGPFAIRYPRGAGEGVAVPPVGRALEVGRARELKAGSAGTILAFGRMVKRAHDAACLLSERGIDVGVIDMRWVKPLDEDVIRRVAAQGAVLVVEEGVTSGGVGQAVLEVIARTNVRYPVRLMGIPDKFVLQGNTDVLLAQLGLDAAGIANAMMELVGNF